MEFSTTLPVGPFDSSAYGVFDTAGNVEEWVQDCWHVDTRGLCRW